MRKALPSVLACVACASASPPPAACPPSATSPAAPALTSAERPRWAALDGARMQTCLGYPETLRARGARPEPRGPFHGIYVAPSGQRFDLIVDPTGSHFLDDFLGPEVTESMSRLQVVGPYDDGRTIVSESLRAMHGGGAVHWLVVPSRDRAYLLALFIPKDLLDPVRLDDVAGQAGRARIAELLQTSWIPVFRCFERALWP